MQAELYTNSSYKIFYAVSKRRDGRIKWCRLSPHFSRAFYCGVGYGHVYGVALGRAPRHTVKYACGALRRALLAKRRIHARLRRLATKSCENAA